VILGRTRGCVGGIYTRDNRTIDEHLVKSASQNTSVDLGLFKHIGGIFYIGWVDCFGFVHSGFWCDEWIHKRCAG